MTEKEEADREYLITKEGIGTYVTDVRTKQRFLKVRGQWFWLTGEGNPFGEDVILPPAAAEYLSKIVKAEKK